MNTRLKTAAPPAGCVRLGRREARAPRGWARWRLARLGLLVVWPVVCAAAEGRLDWKWEAGAVSLVQGDQTLWQFNFGTNATKPFFHPLAVAGGPALTWDQPPDHPWHRALWFSWKYLNGVNYWEPAAGAPVSEGRTEWDPPRILTRADRSARIEMDLRYRPAGGKPVLTERRAIELLPPGPDGALVQDWTLAFRAGEQDVTLSRTPLPGEPGGQPWGGYAGLSVRFAREFVEARAMTSLSAVEFKDGTHRSKAPAMDYSGRVGGIEAGVAILDHPSNLNSPSPWYAIRDDTMRYFSPAVLCFQAHTLKAGGELRLRYRLIAHPGRWTAEQLRQTAERFAGQ